ncbi:hypothetical protein [Rossellomorea aquimaris]|uniref:hypothetical protein n=1 Tax=Rossellomorea aquimaris TaxID=189382 RepID=UPI0016536D60|nr:hypothetical protein [Rossellomorea aquimaris]
MPKQPFFMIDNGTCYTGSAPDSLPCLVNYKKESFRPAGLYSFVRSPPVDLGGLIAYDY